MPYHQKRYGPAQGGKREANDAPIARRRTDPKKFTTFLFFGENISEVSSKLAFHPPDISETDMPHSQKTAQFPAIRMRRMRKDAFSRAMMRENTITTSDLIYPVFILDARISAKKSIRCRELNVCQLTCC